MSSYDFGKNEVVEWIRRSFPEDSTILDVGACDGKWRKLLYDYPNMDGVEIFTPNAIRCSGLYRKMFEKDIADLEYDYYDLIIFGDVIEHMEVEKAQKVLEYAEGRCKDFIVAVPYEYKQGMIYGNPYEVHIQDDLTPEIMDERYHLQLLHDTGMKYAFYHRMS